MKTTYEWKCTDPYTGQYGRQITQHIFEFKQKDVEPTIIDLNNYLIADRECNINPFGYTLVSGENKNPNLSNIHEIYGPEANWIIAECIFESEI